jgi:ATP-binding cassette, subfamily B, multidrug efflux pump
MKSYKLLKEDLVKNRWRVLIGLLALLVVDLLQLFIPRVVKHAIDDLTAGSAVPSHLLFYGLDILAIALGIGFFRYIWRYFLMGTARRIERALRDRFFIYLQTLSPSYFSRTKVGDLMAHATNDIEAVRMSIAMGLVFMVDTIILGVMTIFFMIYIHPLLTLFAILPMPLITAVTLFFSRTIHERFSVLQKTFSLLTERIRESISGIRVVKAYVQDEKEREKLSGISRDYVRKNIDVTKVWGMFFPLILFFSNISLAIVLYLGGRLTIYQSISTGDFVAFMSYLGMLSWPMMALGWAINVIQRGAASLDRLKRIFDEVPEISDSPEAVGIEPLGGRIEVKNLTFSPGHEKGEYPILKEVSLTLQKGERVIVVGRTGSGKSVLCNLLVRLLESPKGTLFYDGKEIRHFPLHVLRGSIGYVPQDTFLFSDTIRANIAFGKTDVGDGEIEEAARFAQIYDEIMEFPDGMDTVVGEKGITLSGGQRQRIAIARAVLMNPPIFILDDALSSVDIQTEERILDQMDHFLQEKTSILITHRIAPLRRANRIIVLDEGIVAETGDHAGLLARGGVYAEIYREREMEEELERNGLNHVR